MIANVGGAMTSGWPSALAASGSRYAGLASPMASANSRIFSRPTSYGAVGAYTRPTNDWSNGMTQTLARVAVRKVGEDVERRRPEAFHAVTAPGVDVGQRRLGLALRGAQRDLAGAAVDQRGDRGI